MILPEGNNEVVLVVDDEESIRNITKETLELYHYRVLTAIDGTEALTLYAQRGDEVRLIITDIMMPFLDGRATVRALRRMNPSVGIIGTSGLADSSSTSDMNDLEIQAFLPKPYTAEKLILTVFDVLHRRKTDRG